VTGDRAGDEPPGPGRSTRHEQRQPITRRQVLQLTWPIILANAAVPLLGLVDTAVIGRSGGAKDLGAIAVGALVFSFVYWSFGFLRMGTTGFVAQASGAEDSAEARASVTRALLLGASIGAVVVLLQRPIAALAWQLLGASAETEARAGEYFHARIWGAPATLCTFALFGCLIGLGKTRHLLALQLLLNGVNIGLDVLLAGVLGWGVRGLGIGTAVAEWITLLAGLWLVLGVLRRERDDAEPMLRWARVLQRERFLAMLRTNLDIMLRTLFLLAGFAWFTDRSAQLGDVTLAANHVLLQFVSFSAFFLDGYAFAAESLVGKAIGSGDRSALDAAIWRSTQLAAVTAVCLAGLFFTGGVRAIGWLTTLTEVRASAAQQLPLCALYMLLSFAAFQLDGVFIGATRTRAMRDASLGSLLVFLVSSWLLLARFGNTGLWAAFVIYVVARGLALAVQLPALRRELTPAA